jgi:hypothetical protein
VDTVWNATDLAILLVVLIGVFLLLERKAVPTHVLRNAPLRLIVVQEPFVTFNLELGGIVVTATSFQIHMIVSNREKVEPLAFWGGPVVRQHALVSAGMKVIATMIHFARSNRETVATVWAAILSRLMLHWIVIPVYL